MRPLTWRDRLRDRLDDVLHPINWVQRRLAIRYCQRWEVVMVDSHDPLLAYRQVADILGVP